MFDSQLYPLNLYLNNKEEDIVVFLSLTMLKLKTSLIVSAT